MSAWLLPGLIGFVLGLVFGWASVLLLIGAVAPRELPHGFQPPQPERLPEGPPPPPPTNELEEVSSSEREPPMVAPAWARPGHEVPEPPGLPPRPRGARK